MKDYSNYAVAEAVNNEISKAFIESVKFMDSEIAKRRLSAILGLNSTDADFKSIAAQFILLVGCKTSAD
jgi:hypothetical protein